MPRQTAARRTRSRTQRPKTPERFGSCAVGSPTSQDSGTRRVTRASLCRDDEGSNISQSSGKSPPSRKRQRNNRGVAPMMDIRACCSRQDREGEALVECCCCRSWHHAECARLDPALLSGRTYVVCPLCSANRQTQVFYSVVDFKRYQARGQRARSFRRRHFYPVCCSCDAGRNPDANIRGDARVECGRCHERFHEPCVAPTVTSALDDQYRDDRSKRSDQERNDLTFMCADCASVPGGALVPRDQCSVPTVRLQLVDRTAKRRSTLHRAFAHREIGVAKPSSDLQHMGQIEALGRMEMRSLFDMNVISSRPISLCTAAEAQLYIVGTMMGSLYIRSAVEAVTSRVFDVGWAVTALSSIGGTKGVVAAGGWDGDVALLDLSSLRAVSCASVHRHIIKSTAFDAKSSPIMATASTDKTVRLIDWRAGRAQGFSSILLGRHQAEVAGARFLDDRCIVSCGSDDCIKIWDVRRPNQCVALVETECEATSIDATEHHVAVNLANNECLVFDSSALCAAASEVAATRLVGHDNDLWGIGPVKLNSTGSSVVAGSEDGSLCIWSVDSGQLVRRIHSHSGCVWDVAWLSEYEIISVSDDGSVCRLGIPPPHTNPERAEWRRGQRVLARSGDGAYHHAIIQHQVVAGEGRRAGEAVAVKYRTPGWGSEGLLVMGRGAVLPDDTACTGCTAGHVNSQILREWPN